MIPVASPHALPWYVKIWLFPLGWFLNLLCR